MTYLVPVFNNYRTFSRIGFVSLFRFGIFIIYLSYTTLNHTAVLFCSIKNDHLSGHNDLSRSLPSNLI